MSWFRRREEPSSEPDPARFVAIDFETAGPQRATACAVGWAVVEDMKVTNTGSQIIDPMISEAEWGGFNVMLHGIHPSDTKGMPQFPEVWKSLSKMVGSAPIVAHNAPFDVGVVRAEAARHELDLNSFHFACSAKLSRRAWPELSSVSLANVSEFLDIELNHHDAQSDALASAQIVLEAAEKFGAGDLPSTLVHAKLMLGEVRGSLDWTKFGAAANEADYWRLGIRQGTDPNHPFFGEVIVFTETLHSMVRADAKRLVFEAGAEVGKSITRKTTVLVHGEDDPSKWAPGATRSNKSQDVHDRRAKGQDIQIIEEDDFLRLLG